MNNPGAGTMNDKTDFEPFSIFLLNKLLFEPHSIENISDLLLFVDLVIDEHFGSDQNSVFGKHWIDSNAFSITDDNILKGLYERADNRKRLTFYCLYTALKFNAIRIRSLEGKYWYEKSADNIRECIAEIDRDWHSLGEVEERFKNQNFLVEYWIDWTDHWKMVLRKLRIITDQDH